jgi:hypothetical protein
MQSRVVVVSRAMAAFRTCVRRVHDLGPQRAIDQQAAVTKALRQVVHPKTGQDIVYSGHIKGIEIHHGGIVSLTLALDTEYRVLKAECQKVFRGTAACK